MNFRNCREHADAVGTRGRGSRGYWGLPRQRALVWGSTEGLPCSPCQPGQAHAGSAPVCILTGGEGLWPPLLQAWSCGPAIWASPGCLLQGRNTQAPPPGTGLSAGQGGIQIRTIQRPGPVIRTPRSPAAKDLVQSLRSETTWELRSHRPCGVAKNKQKSFKNGLQREQCHSAHRTHIRWVSTVTGMGGVEEERLIRRLSVVMSKTRSPPGRSSWVNCFITRNYSIFPGLG